MKNKYTEPVFMVWESFKFNFVFIKKFVKLEISDKTYKIVKSSLHISKSQLKLSMIFVNMPVSFTPFPCPFSVLAIALFIYYTSVPGGQKLLGQ